jgi:hypothetical protein
MEWFPGRGDVVPFVTAVGVLGVWWFALGIVLRRFHRTVKVTFSPFADWFDRGHGVRLALIGVLLAAASLVVLIGMYREA